MDYKNLINEINLNGKKLEFLSQLMRQKKLNEKFL